MSVFDTLTECIKVCFIAYAVFHIYPHTLSGVIVVASIAYKVECVISFHCDLQGCRIRKIIKLVRRTPDAKPSVNIRGSDMLSSTDSERVAS